MKIKCGEVILLLDKHLCLLLYISLPVPCLSSYKYSVCTFLSGIHFKSPDSSRVYSHMFLIEGREMVYLKTGVGDPPRENVRMEAMAPLPVKNAPLNTRMRGERKASEAHG